jgi:hypothetical protein
MEQNLSLRLIEKFKGFKIAIGGKATGFFCLIAIG